MADRWVVFDRAYRGLTGGFLMLWNVIVAISVNFHVCLTQFVF